MDKEIINISEKDHNNIGFTVNYLFNEIKNDKIYEELLEISQKTKDYSLVEKYLDEFYNYICELIDISDKFTLSYSKKDLEEYYYKRLKHEDCYMTHKVGIDTFLSKRTYLFDISNKKDKEVLKDNIKFNVIGMRKKLIELDINRKYISNKVEIENHAVKNLNVYSFINKDNEIIAELWGVIGKIHDFRDEKVVNKKIEKLNENPTERINRLNEILSKEKDKNPITILLKKFD